MRAFVTVVSRLYLMSSSSCCSTAAEWTMLKICIQRSDISGEWADQNLQKEMDGVAYFRCALRLCVALAHRYRYICCETGKETGKTDEIRHILCTLSQ